MGLRFIIGRSGTGKTDYCMTEIINKQKRDLNVIYIVPEQFSLQAEKELSKKNIGKGILNAKVITFGRLYHNIALEKGGNIKELLDETAKSMVLRKIIFDNEKKLLYYRNSIDKRGFMEQLCDTIKELHQYNINNEIILNTIDKINENSSIKIKLKDLSIIFDNYNKYIKDNYISIDEKLDVLINDIRDSNIIKNAYVYIDGFYTFTPQEINVIFEIMKFANDVNVILPIDKYTYYSDNITMSNLFFEPLQVIKRLILRAKENDIKVYEPIVFGSQKRIISEGIKHIEKYFNYYNPKISNNYNGIKIFSVNNKYDEVENCAINIIKMVSNNNIRFREIAVLMRDLKDYENTIKSVFWEYNIPIFIDRKEEIISQPLIEFVRSIIDIVNFDFSYESIFRFLKIGFIPIEKEKIDIIENYVLAYGIKSYKWHSEWKYGFNNEEDEEYRNNLNNIKNTILDFIKPFYENIKRDKKYEVSYIINCLYNSFKVINISKILSNRVNIFKCNGDIGKAEKYKQVWKIINTIFERLNSFLGNEKITVLEFSKILDAGFSEGRFAIIPPTVDSVTIGDIERTRLPNIKAIFVIGVNEGILPSPSDVNGLFSDTERDMISLSGLEIAPDAKRRAFEEQFLIYMGITKPSDYLYMSFRKSDIDGKALRPSPIINKIKNLFSNIDIIKYDTTFKKNIDDLVAPIPILHSLGENLRNIYEGKDNLIWRDIMAFYCNDENWRKKINIILNSIYDKNISEVISKSTIKKLYNGELYSSVSKLEKYVSCPYAYFVEYILSAKERKLYEIGTPDLGFLFHDILETFSVKINEMGIKWNEITKNDIENIVNNCVLESIPKLSNELILSKASYKYLVKRLQRVSKRAINTLTEHIKSGKFKPYSFEMGFGINELLPPIIIELTNGEKMIINGKIDRVDILDSNGKVYIKIIDYKSGSKDFNIQDIYYGLQLQLMIYIGAIIKNLNILGDILPAGAFYFKIKDPITKSVTEMTAEEIENELLKELKMSGLILNNEVVFEGLDEKLKFGESSDIVPISFGVNGNLKKLGTSVASEFDYMNVINFTTKKAKAIGESILSGFIEIKPYKKKDLSACRYCSYHSICRFDSTNEENNYNNLNDIKDEEIWEEIRKNI